MGLGGELGVGVGGLLLGLRGKPGPFCRWQVDFLIK